jgi:hypothetical protein
MPQAETVPHVFMIRSDDRYWCNEDQDIWYSQIIAGEWQGRVRFPTRTHAEARIRSMLSKLEEHRQYWIEKNDPAHRVRVERRILRWKAAKVVCISTVLSEIEDPA